VGCDGETVRRRSNEYAKLKRERNRALSSPSSCPYLTEQRAVRQPPQSADAGNEEGLQRPVQQRLGACQQEEVAKGHVAAAPQQQAREHAAVEGEIRAEDCGLVLVWGFWCVGACVRDCRCLWWGTKSDARSTQVVEYAQAGSWTARRRASASVRCAHWQKRKRTCATWFPAPTQLPPSRRGQALWWSKRATHRPQSWQWRVLSDSNST
jgi:hypothetical protein